MLDIEEPKEIRTSRKAAHHTFPGPLAGRAVMLRFAWLLAGASAVTQTFYVCNDAGDLDFRGSYDLDEDTHANKPTWTNAQGKTIFAHGPFWYIGDLSPHPVETGYRGVVDCPRNADEPGTDCVYTASKNGREPVPVLSTAPCGGGEL